MVSAFISPQNPSPSLPQPAPSSAAPTFSRSAAPPLRRSAVPPHNAAPRSAAPPHHAPLSQGTLCVLYREVSEARSSEIKAWAHVQGLKSSLDERNLELRVKVAIEAEAIAQQRLAASEAEIAKLRQKLEASKRSIPSLAEICLAIFLNFFPP
ncbi:E3 ubiquitin-protein ligase BRE1-like 1 [Sesamum alatum]|uniref:E3 ubiquitin protein ligase n=1 Tax=Sesamum alatum TaxID=300844 RepID=A0AAE2CM39_9LAMI|nr:E3 ubiquitin-protein ligase BRE1-like 1 [Sesamum alatum]